MAYTNVDKSDDHFNTKLYTGNSGTQAITGVGFQPDWVWIKRRDASAGHKLSDAVSGVNKQLVTNNANAQNSDTNILTAFGSDGFTLGNSTDVNNNTSPNVAWNWKAGGSASSNSNGSITSSVSANTTAGFSIVSYTGTGSNATVGHGLGSELGCYIIKQINSSGGWIVYNKGNTSSPETDYLRLDKTDATVDDAIFNDTLPTSSVFSIGTNAPVNTSSGTYIAYCFAQKKGFSKMGSYTGNGSADGPFVYTGFKPAFVMIKCSSNSGHNWQIRDNERPGYNATTGLIKPNQSNAEQDTDNIDLLSNGFKQRNSAGDDNGSGQTYIYMAFAENPFVTSTGVPATAR